jgi:hypothetical protein
MHRISPVPCAPSWDGMRAYSSAASWRVGLGARVSLRLGEAAVGVCRYMKPGTQTVRMRCPGRDGRAAGMPGLGLGAGPKKIPGFVPGGKGYREADYRPGVTAEGRFPASPMRAVRNEEDRR